ncbi:MAG: hypothetical protein A3D92_24170 [Bacteroidetes bacterium RIFCSPHIGHO2_02_FULL_44_7]|nr:MAG: hypothetical protein A3D92_24170 [Bacteroidetes bacterium RIFCSPHIGHO2_02_FULL_44_7]
MKIYRFLLILSMALPLLGCKKVDKLTQFEMEFDETLVIPASSGINLPFNVVSPDIETNSESTFEVNDTRKDLIEQIKLRTLNLVVTSPSNSDFSFLKAIHIYISADGLSEIEIASKENVAENTTVLSLDVSDADLKEYIKADQFSLRLNTETDEVMTSDHHIALHSVFFVDAKILGQ